MATSSKVQFSLEKLQAAALASIDSRIAAQRKVLEEFNDPAALKSLLVEWRAKQEEKISQIFSELGPGGIDDLSLSRFKLDPIPELEDEYDRRRVERHITELEGRRTKIVAKSGSLVPDADGSISLTKTQLAEFFDL